MFFRRPKPVSTMELIEQYYRGLTNLGTLAVKRNAGVVEIDGTSLQYLIDQQTGELKRIAKEMDERGELEKLL